MTGDRLCCLEVKSLSDLKGKDLNLPVYKLLGGSVRERVNAYASTLGYSLEPTLVKQRSKRLVAEGYKAMKWFPRYGPIDGPEGITRNVELIRTIREAVGSNIDIMLDCWMSWDERYTSYLGGWHAVCGRVGGPLSCPTPSSARRSSCWAKQPKS